MLRFVRRFVHLLVGLLAIALVAGAARLIWPHASNEILLGAYVVMMALCLREIFGLLTNKPGK